MTHKLPPAERVRILSNRAANIRNGAGDFLACNRPQAIEFAESALAEALRDLETNGDTNGTT